MKFTDGYWRMRPDIVPYFAVQVHETKLENGVLTVYAATGQVTGRNDTMDLPVLTVQFSSPMPNVIRVQIYHHKGGRPAKPLFDLEPDEDHEVSIEEDEETATLTSCQLSVRVQKGDWRVEFRDGERVITGSGRRGWAIWRPPMATMSTSSWTSASASACTAWASGSARSSRTARWSTSGTRTAAPAASRPTRTCRST